VKKYPLYLDSHTHSDSSPDGAHSVTFMCESAVAKGVRGLCITDHCEANAYQQDHYDVTIRQSLFETAKARSVFSEQLLVTFGIELGQALEAPEAAAHALRYFYDFVLGSLHSLPGEEDFYFLTYTPENIPDYLNRYFGELLKLAETGDFDSLAHIFYPLRYMGEVDITPYRGVIDGILSALARREKALEINTSAGKRVEPPVWVLRRFRELGGKYITVGSDSHNRNDIIAGFDEAFDRAREAGFTEYAFYVRREPVMNRL